LNSNQQAINERAEAPMMMKKRMCAPLICIKAFFASPLRMVSPTPFERRQQLANQGATPFKG
jgi:hypothetical protein